MKVLIFKIRPIKEDREKKIAACMERLKSLIGTNPDIIILHGVTSEILYNIYQVDTSMIPYYIKKHSANIVQKSGIKRTIPPEATPRPGENLVTKLFTIEFMMMLSRDTFQWVTTDEQITKKIMSDFEHYSFAMPIFDNNTEKYFIVATSSNNIPRHDAAEFNHDKFLRAIKKDRKYGWFEVFYDAESDSFKIDTSLGVFTHEAADKNNDIIYNIVDV